jgi:hypothetical protein
MVDVNISDTRNSGIIQLLRPRAVTYESVRERLALVVPRTSDEEINEKARRFMQTVASKRLRPPPPLSEPPSDDVKDLLSMSAHPDLVARIWPKNELVCRNCRWRVFGRPALVHPGTGIIFAVAIGTVGIAIRLPPNTGLHQLGLPVRPGRNPFDLSSAGPEWVFTQSSHDGPAFLEAHKYAGLPQRL